MGVPRRHDFDDISPHGPVANPVDRFTHLPEPTRRWLEQLRDDDLKDLTEAIRFHHSAKTVGRFMKWLILSAAAIFGLAAQFGEDIRKLFGLFFHGAK